MSRISCASANRDQVKANPLIIFDVNSDEHISIVSNLPWVSSSFGTFHTSIISILFCSTFILDFAWIELSVIVTYAFLKMVLLFRNHFGFILDIAIMFMLLLDCILESEWIKIQSRLQRRQINIKRQTKNWKEVCLLVSSGIEDPNSWHLIFCDGFM